METPRSSLSRARERAGVRARRLRRASPDAELKLWNRLRNRQLAGHKFRRQHPIGPFFADFACVEAGLVVELDGGQHFEAEAMDADMQRTKALKQLGFHVLRFDNRQALVETNAVLEQIHLWLETPRPHPDPLPQAGEGAHAKD
jgi:very-short-patch-repair endonuclease